MNEGDFFTDDAGIKCIAVSRSRIKLNEIMWMVNALLWIGLTVAAVGGLFQ